MTLFEMMTKWPRSRGSHTTVDTRELTERVVNSTTWFHPAVVIWNTPSKMSTIFSWWPWRVGTVIWMWEQTTQHSCRVVIQGSFVGVQPCRWGSNSRAKCRAVFQQTTGFHRVWGEAPYQHGRYGGCCKLFNTCKWHPDLWAGIHESQTIPSMAISKYLKNSIPFQAQSLSSFHAKGLDNWTVGKNPVAMAATEFVDYYDLPRP